MSKPNKIPKFESIEEERLFWDTHSFTDFPELKEVRNIRFPLLKHRGARDHTPALDNVFSSSSFRGARPNSLDVVGAGID